MFQPLLKGSNLVQSWLMFLVIPMCFDIMAFGIRLAFWSPTLADPRQPLVDKPYQTLGPEPKPYSQRALAFHLRSEHTHRNPQPHTAPQ